YNTATQKLQSLVDSKNPLYDFSSKIYVDLSDSAKQQINTSIQLRNERISLLKPYLTSILENVDGLANGELRLVGKLSEPQILGDVTLRQAQLKVDYTKCTYFIDSARLRFGSNFINFGTINLADAKGRKGVMEGIMYHRFFDSLSFNMRMRTEGMEVLNTRSIDNDLFYGNVIGKANFDLTGPLTNLQMRISGTPVDSSHVYISNKTSKESGEADFIVFKTYGEEMQPKITADATNLLIDLDLTANPLVKIDVILDEATNDVLKASGRGNLRIRTGTFEETVMRGRYQLERGSYDYNFQSIFKKPFLLEGGDDSWIEWQGDPLDANLNIKALYVAEKVSLRDLMSSEQGRTVLDQDAQGYKGNVYVRANIAGKLSSPRISFEIDFPPGSNMRNNLSANDMLRRIKDDESEMLRQVTYLIVFGSFAPYKQGTGNVNPGAGFAVNTLSDILSKEMGKILTQLVQGITGDRSLNVDISTDFYNSQALASGNVSASTGYDRVNFNFMLNKSFFNNRIVFNVGSDFDVNVRNTAASGFEFLPDVSVEFILTRNRRLRGIIFKRDNLDFQGRRNRAGASLSYRRDFDRVIGDNREEALIYIR
ncbi:MAG TPA: translocation/assembly module TamB domain-containing protein, partial [Phnomibacter sp.]|nr:translocation/assembly module TamB domain-containing protein [Phnomibacter sp.]